ncbi:MAG: hypothetical protein ACI8PP_001437 [Candidatus Pseudothioglobus sp.]|jgi:hypothetical protein
MSQLTSYEQRALESIETPGVWFSAEELGQCRLATLNRLVEKGRLERARRPGPYSPNASVLFLLKGDEEPNNRH